ncbi:MAG: TonB-dependent receptor [Casimicrobiaceae bacterium]|nr:TonB-dependent receptor [Pseudomonadota bacterium]
MSFERNKVAAALACIMGAGAAMAVSGAYAQAVSPDVPSLTRQPAPDIRVEVTGSNIKRVEGEGALPVQVITRSEIDKSGATNVQELLSTISANTSAGQVMNSQAIGATTLSQQGASLRGLGPARTLVLINGHRLDQFAGAIGGVEGGVNISAIPFAAIERVEILKDGASAIYGSDAIGGVINFITRSDYTGADVTAQYGAPTRGGGADQWSGSGSFGFGDLAKDRYNAFGSVSYQEQKPLDQNKRNFSNTSYIPSIGYNTTSSNTFPGNITTGHIGVVHNGHSAAPNECAPSVFFPDFNSCRFDPAAADGVEMLGHQKTWNAFGQGRFQINSDWQAYVTGLYAHDQVDNVIQPSPISNAFGFGPDNGPATVTLQPTSPFYPHSLAQAAGVDGKPLNVRYRSYENGLRGIRDINENGQAVVGVKGTWHDWDVDVSGFYAQGKTTEATTSGYEDYRTLLPILNSGNVNLFGTNTPDVVALLRSANFNGTTLEGKSTSYGAGAKTSGEIWKLPAGALSVAFGGDAGKEQLDQNPADAIQGGYITGYGGQNKPVTGSRTRWDAFGEVNIPIVKTLEADAQVRYDHYSDFGGTTNPKFTLRWQPTRSVLVRGSYGTGFLAPALYELFSAQTFGVSQVGLNDPIRCPVTNNQGIDCSAQFPVIFGGNPSLKPEESEQATLGVVVEPFTGASFSIDYFKINMKDQIQNGIAQQTILADLAQFGHLVTRGAPTPDFPNLAGPISAISQTYTNLTAVRLQGLDLEAAYRTPIQNWGRLSFNLNGTYYLRYDNKNPDGTWQGNVGTLLNSVIVTNTGIVPRWKHYVSATWDQGPWSATLAQTFQTSYTDSAFADQLVADVPSIPRTVGSLSIWDLQGTYSGFKNLKLTLGVKNLFDRNPPLTNQGFTFQAGFDPSYYDPRARFVYGSVNYKFK